MSSTTIVTCDRCGKTPLEEFFTADLNAQRWSTSSDRMWKGEPMISWEVCRECLHELSEPHIHA